MKKCLSIILAVLVGISVTTGCTKQNNISDNAFNKEEHQKLLALRFDGYEDMTVAEYQNKIWEMTDTTEYRSLLDRFSKDEALYKMKDSNETAAFLFYVLEPLTAEHWETHDYSGFATSDFPLPTENATLEYTFTLKILNADVLTVKEYNNTRLGINNTMQKLLKNKTKEELQNEAVMQAEIQTCIDDVLEYMQTPKIGVEIEYAYFPLSVAYEKQQNTLNGSSEENEERSYTNAKEEDYLALFTLKTPNYKNLPLADFNNALLEWANENYERMERISEDISWNDFQVNLTAEELSFVKLTVFLSGMENGKIIQSSYTNQSLYPYYAEELSKKITNENGVAWCRLYYQFYYIISDPKRITVGERDRQIGDMLNAIQLFWNDSKIENILKMNEIEIVQELKGIAKKYSTEYITMTINDEQVHFECMNERAYTD